MFTEIKNTVGRLIIASLLVVVPLIVYSLFILRGRDVYHFAGAGDSLWHAVEFIRPYLGNAIGNEEESTPFSYSLREISEVMIERKITNHSWRPFLVTMYQFKGWKYSLPDKKLLHYASRYVIHNQRTDLVVDSGTGFSCGTGLGLVLIRPQETFIDTIPVENLIPYLPIRNQFVFPDDGGRVYDRLTGKFIGDRMVGFDQYEANLLHKLVPNDDLDIRLYLPVTDYFSGKRSKVFSTEIPISRWEVLEKGYD